jgi:uncharacterized phage-associated protein
MNSVHDVAKYIVKKFGPISAMKLQKLVYYSQAWSLVWEERPLFTSRIEAWASGPVIPALYEFHRGTFMVGSWPRGDETSLRQSDRETINAVVKFYGKKTAQELSELTHREAPWANARKGVPDGERSNAQITDAALDEYYSSL